MSASASTLPRRPAVRAHGQRFAEAAAAALEPLKAELLRRANGAAAERLQQAAAEDAATVAQAEHEAALIVDQARQEGIAEAAALVAAQRARSRRQAREVVLRARAEAWAELRQRSMAAVTVLSTEPAYRELHSRLVDYVRAELGTEAVISDAPTGGVIGTVPGRRLDCSFATLVEQGLAERAATAQHAMNDMAESRVTRVVGPLVELDGATSLAMADVVRLGPAGLPGEVVAIRDGIATIQAYEYTGGLRPGDPARSLGEPLSVPLGPGLLGGVFDGLLRPLADAPAWLAPGTTSQRGQEREWPWRPGVRAGDQVGPGDCLGIIEGAGAVEHRVLVPPRLSGAVTAVREGPCPSHGALASVAGVDVPLRTSWPIRRPRPARERLESTEPLSTGQRVLDLLFPVARGSTAAVPGGFGTGKTVLLQQLAKWCDADVIVYVGCGERGNEMAEVVEDLAELEDPRTGGRLADRTVVIANTSNMPMMAREASIYTGVSVAEYYRDMGYHAVVIADSTSRWAEALREFGTRSGALPTEEGYPADLASALRRSTPAPVQLRRWAVRPGL